MNLKDEIANKVNILAKQEINDIIQLNIIENDNDNENTPIK